MQHLYIQSIELLKQLISTPSLSSKEDKAVDVLKIFFHEKDIEFHQKKNNIWLYNKYYQTDLPTILLNSHIDTVKPNAAYTLDPFSPIVKKDKLFGLGSNDAGGALVSLIATFLHFYAKKNLTYNLCLAITAEEEISGKNSICSIVECLSDLSFGIIGEPTNMHMAIAEKGLLVLDCTAKGKSSHAAHQGGVNPILIAMQDIARLQAYKFPKTSKLLGEIKLTPTIIHSGSQHNVIPSSCSFTVDIRTTDAYTNEEVFDRLKNILQSDAKPRSFRLRPSVISEKHPIVRAGMSLHRKYYGSPTLSDMALLDIPAVKIGPGESTRSHTADEFIYLNEIKEGIVISGRIKYSFHSWRY